MIYGSIWVARGEKSNVKNVKIIISDSDFFRGLCPGDVTMCGPVFNIWGLKYMKYHKHMRYHIFKNRCPIHIFKIRCPPYIKNRCPLHKYYIYIYDMNMRGYGGIWWDMGGYGTNGARGPRVPYGPEGPSALHISPHIPPYPTISQYSLLLY